MPAKCKWCENNNHGDHDKEQHPTCERHFLTSSEAWAIIAESKPHDAMIHVVANPRENILVGGERTRKEIKDMLETADYIEHCDPEGHARKMKHGLYLMDSSHRGWFVETDEEALKAYEELFINGNG
jgi:hypothetical protein